MEENIKNLFNIKGIQFYIYIKYKNLDKIFIPILLKFGIF